MQRSLLSLLLICIVFLGCQTGEQESLSAIDVIPAEADFVYRFEDLSEFMADIRNNPVATQSAISSPIGRIGAEAWLFDQLPLDKRAHLALVKNGEGAWSYLLINDLRTNPINLDSVLGPSEGAGTTGHRTWTTDTGTVHGNVLDSLLLLSDRSDLLPTSAAPLTGSRNKVLTMDTGSDIQQVIPIPEVLSLDTVPNRRTSWAGLEYNLLPEGILANGVVLPQDSTNLFMRLFKGLNPQPVRNTSLVPNNSVSVTGITFDDTATFFENRQYGTQFDSLSAPYHPAYETVDEVAHIVHPTGQALILHSLDIDQALLEFGLNEESAREFRGVTLYQQNVDPELQSALFPLLPEVEVSHVFSVEEFIVLSNDAQLAEAMIACRVSGNCLLDSPGFQQLSVQLSTAASYYQYRLEDPIQPPLSNWLGLSPQQLKGYQLGAVQLSADRGFAHINLVATEQVESTVASSGISEQFSLELPNAILNSPQLFTNHRTKGKDVVVQDVTNTLHFISSGGKLLWSKELEYPILGEIKEVDILRNGKKQLAFATTKALHVLDRNGNAVAPFPKQFNDDITQPLALFDYDNNRNYRFVIVQNEEIWMFDRQAKTVEGFGFRKAGSPVILPPVHIRMNNKDYLLFAESDGKLNILNRRGKPRIKVNENLVFSTNPLEQEGDRFVVITNDKKKVSISESGSATTQDLDVTDSYWFVVEGSTKATMDDNLLRINGKLVELPYDLYAQPKIFTVNRKVFVSVTGTQEEKVYLFDRSGNAINGFPVYGTSVIDLADTNRNGKPELVVRGGPNEILLYGID